MSGFQDGYLYELREKGLVAPSVRGVICSAFRGECVLWFCFILDADFFYVYTHDIINLNNAMARAIECDFHTLNECMHLSHGKLKTRIHSVKTRCLSMQQAKGQLTFPPRSQPLG